MAQHDYSIANQGFPAFRSDLNNALAAIVSNNSGATEPTTMFAHQMWVDTAANPSILKIRNADNDAWITIGTINQTGDTFTLTSAVSATTLNTSGAVVFNDAGADVDFRVEGDTDANLLFVDAGNDRVGIGTSSPSEKLHVVGKIAVSGTNPSIRQVVQNAYLDLCGGTTVGTDPSIQIAGSTTTSDANKVFYNANTHLFRSSSGGTTYATIDSDGLKFNGDTAAANALDDYEEGTFDPTIIGGTTAGTASYTDRNGRYTKIGNRVLFTLYVNWTGGTGTGSLRVAGLPFTAANASNLQSVSVYNINVAMTANHVMQTLVAPNATRVDINSYPTGGGSDANVNYDSAGVLFIGGQYETA